jgi:hypothetical protein
MSDIHEIYELPERPPVPYRQLEEPPPLHPVPPPSMTRPDS